MTPDQLSRIVLHSVRRAVDAGELHVTVPERVLVETPPRPGCGDWATNVALRLAKELRGRPGGPRAVAEVLRRRLENEPGIAGVEIAGPGFLNITLDAGSHAGLVRTVRRLGTTYGHGRALAGTTVTFAAPTEPRAAVVTEAAVRLLRSQGATAAVAPAGTAGERLRVTPVPDRAGDLFDRLGPDAARWALLRPAAHDTPVLDPALLLAQREANPLFRVRYAHARSRALLRNARDLGFGPDEDAPAPVSPGTPAGHPGASGTPDAPAAHAGAVRPGPGRTATPAPTGHAVVPAPPDARAGHLDAPGTGPDAPGRAPETGGPGAADAGPYGPPDTAGALLAVLADHPRVVTAAARHRAPDRLARHLETTADAFFRWLDNCPVLPSGEEKPSAAHRSRLALADAAGTVLAGGLALLGIDAPDIL
ncbi:ArgS-related anticodon-binding protein NrtL [Streptomyces pactum]|uniref:ArgS-related anticodon-binding protein NrtL n=1 Tax=Streptomyces pactum TaxID=68249 RepID=UPI0036F8D2C7